MKTWQDVPGWFDFDDIYDEVVAERKMYTRVVNIVEIGVAMGRSAIYMATKIRDEVPPGSEFRFWVVDSWAGLSGDEAQRAEAAALGGGRQLFQRNARDCGVDGWIRILHGDQLKAAGCFHDGTCDLVFLDADHSLKGTAAAISAWLPKVRPGGIFAGHDFTPEHPGVVEAVRLLLPGATKRRSSFFWRVPS